MKWKCINDIFGYCAKEPTGASEAKTLERETTISGIKQIVTVGIGGATCTKDPASCKQYRTFTQVCSAKAGVKKPVVKTTFVADKKAKKDKGKQEGLLC